MTTTLALYGNTQDIEKFAGRLRDLLPGGKKMTPNDAMALAQVSAVHGLDPFNGEIWFIPGVGVMIGVKGLRKKAREQVKGNFWTTFRELSDPKERERLMVPEGALAFECRLFDSETSATYTETIKGLRGADVPIADVMEIVGKQPYTLGIGVLKKGEATRMLPAECAMKRAEAAALKRRFDVPFQADTEHEPDAFIDGSFTTDAPPPERVDTATGELLPEGEPAAAQATTQAAEKPMSNGAARPWTAAHLREHVRGKVAGAKLNGAASPEMVKHTAIALASVAGNDDHKRKALMEYLVGKGSTKDLTTGESSVLRNWVGATKNDAGEWIPNAWSITEAQRVIAAHAIEHGQQTMPIEDGVTALEAFFTESAPAGK